MSPREIVALCSPLVPLALLVATLYGPWCVQIFGPAQFVAQASEVTLAAICHRALPEIAAGSGFLIASAGLLAVICYDRWVGWRARTLLRWEDFERDFHAYARDAAARRHDGPPSRG